MNSYPQPREGSPVRRRPRKGLYLLPSMFTAGNLAAGYYAIAQAIQGTAADPWHFDMAAKAIGFAIVFDFFDGGIARLTNTASDFGRELDSLADVITFGVAPAVLAWMWGFRMLPMEANMDWRTQVIRIGAVMTFTFVLAGASRLARFNIQVNPQPSNPGRPGRKYFVGMPIPAGAGTIAAVVHFQKGFPLESWYTAITWLAMVAAVGYLMVSTWRFYSFKDIDFRSRHPFRLILFLAALFASIWFFSRQMLFVIALFYMVSGVFWRVQWIFRRKSDPPPPFQEASQTS